MIELGKGRARRAHPLPTQWQKAGRAERTLCPRSGRRNTAMDIIHDDYQVHYDVATATVLCQGSFRLRGTEEYAPILQVLTAAADVKPATLTLDLRTLRFLNSSGINTLAKFVLHVRQYEATQVVIKGSQDFPWQEKSLKNFLRLLPRLHLEIE